MNFKSVSIKNFRNFEDITVDLGNKNIFFGLNDVGKTNFLYALRFILDKEIRKNNLLDSDFHCKNIKEPIEIIIKLDISDNQCVDNQKLRAKLKGSISYSQTDVYVKLVATYDKNEMLGIPLLYWGGDLNNLTEMKQRGYLYEIDYVVNVIYIDSYVDLNKLFKKNVNTLIKNNEASDNATLNEISDTIELLNGKISSLSGIKDFETRITPEYKKFRNDNIAVSVKSEIAVKGLYSNIVPYIKRDDKEELYPTSGEGRKKLLVYSIFDLISKDSDEKKINIFLIEEPENHLHKSIQIALSKILFDENGYKYLFITTHSPFILHEMDNVNLIRIYNESKIDSISEFYSVPEEYKLNKKILNNHLSEAIFADKVLLVEGPSEENLFNKVLSTINPFYEADGIYVLPVNGIGFRNYFEILNGLNIVNIIKTDNDLRKDSNSDMFSVLGFSRINSYLNDKAPKLPTAKITSNTIIDKINLYNDNITILDTIRNDYKIFLSKSDLENDLDEFFHNEMKRCLGVDNVVEHLQSSKHYNMVKLIKNLTDDDCKKIYDHYNFACLKEVLE